MFCVLFVCLIRKKKRVLLLNRIINIIYFRRNQQSKTELEKDWSDKWEAYNIDTTCAHMKNTSSEQIAFYTGPQRIPNK